MYGIRAERRNDGWHMNWAFELPEDEAVRENFGEETISGRVVIDPEYRDALIAVGKVLFIAENAESFLVGMRKKFYSVAITVAIQVKSV